MNPDSQGAGEPQKWDVPKGRRKAQGVRYLDINMRADLGEYGSEIAGDCCRRLITLLPILVL
jgi:hypothetical protein